MKNKKSFVAIAFAAFIGAVVLTDFGKNLLNSADSGLTKIRVGYIGLTCEAPLFVAKEKGFFQEEKLDVSMIKCEWANYKDVIALGGFDITHHLIMYLLKPIEQGLNVRFTSGVHHGCLRVQAGVNSNIHSIGDLRGKKIGIPGMGTPPFIFASRVLGSHGIDPSKDVTWIVFPAGELGLALEKGAVDAVANAEPIGSLLLTQKKVRNIADQATDSPYASEYCCAVAVNGKFLTKNPKAAAAATRAILKAAKWVETNPAAAARLAVEKNYLAANVDLNSFAISHLKYEPSVLGAQSAVKSAAFEMKKAKMLNANTDPGELANRAFVKLDGVTDDWLKSVKVEKVANGQLSPNFDILKFASAATAADADCMEKMSKK